MKTATLIALIASILEMLIQLVYLGINLGSNLFHLQINFNDRIFGLIAGPLFVVFVASLAYFFLILYQNQKS